MTSNLRVDPSAYTVRGAGKLWFGRVPFLGLACVSVQRRLSGTQSSAHSPLPTDHEGGPASAVQRGHRRQQATAAQCGGQRVLQRPGLFLPDRPAVQ